jgi:hypothetical protein
MSVHEYRQRAEELLDRAVRTTDLKMRGAVLEQALMWHHLAVEAHAHRRARGTNDPGKVDDAGATYPDERSFSPPGEREP